MSNFSVSVVIPNYNGRYLLEQNLPSVYLALQKSISNYEIIVCDDNSTDGTTQSLETNFPEVVLLPGYEKRRGFSTNINRGIRLAKKDLVLCLNTDVVLDGDFFMYSLPHFARADTFGVAPSFYNQRGSRLLEAGKAFTTKYLFIKSLPDYQVSSFQDYHYNFYLCGASALMRREPLQKMGGFCEAYDPFYGEDVDLGLRAWQLGFRLYYEARAKCYHSTSATIQSAYTKKEIAEVAARNKFLTPYLHWHGGRRTLWLFYVCFNFLTRFIILDWLYYKGLYLFIKRRHINTNARRAWLTAKAQAKKIRSLVLVKKQLKEKLAYHRTTP